VFVMLLREGAGGEEMRSHGDEMGKEKWNET
jgi:hypothetical protein